jgi:hypothetical protein
VNLEPLAAGRRISPEEAARLESELASYPDDLPRRLKLLGFYERRWDKNGLPRLSVHYAWLVAHFPRLDFDHELGFVHSVLIADPEPFARGKQAWLDAIAEHPQDAQVLWSAVGYSASGDPAFALDMARNGRALEPNQPRWPLCIGELLQQMDHHAEALHEFETAIVLASPEKRLEILPMLAEAAFAADNFVRAKQAAEQLLVLTPVGADEKPNARQDVHTAWIVLGRIALADGDLDGACSHLAAAGVGRIGPDLGLATALIARGRERDVAEYLEACGEIWNGQSTLEAWRIRYRSSGRTET